MCYWEADGICGVFDARYDYFREWGFLWVGGGTGWSGRERGAGEGELREEWGIRGVRLTYMGVQLDTAGIRPLASAKRLQQEAYKAWFIGLTFNTVAGLYTLFQLRQRELSINKKDGEGVVESKKVAKYVYFCSWPSTWEGKC